MNTSALNDSITAWRDSYAAAPGQWLVVEGTRTLTRWAVQEDDYEGGFYVTHYVGGEDYEVVFGDYDTRQEAKAVASALSLLPEPLQYTYTRAWEG